MDNPVQALVKRRLQELDRSPADAARKGGLARTFLYDVINGRSKNPRADKLKGIAKAVDLPPEMVIAVQNEVPVIEPERVSEDEEWQEEARERAEYERHEVDSLYSTAVPYKPKIPGGLPELDIHAGAGEGKMGEVYDLQTAGIASGHRVVAEWKFSDAWLQNEVKASPARTIVMPIVGDSMRPTYQPGDRVLVDLTQREIIDGVIFVVSIDEGAPSVKRVLEVYQSKPKMLTIVSDNPAIRDRDVEARIVTIVGRVVSKLSIE